MELAVQQALLGALGVVFGFTLAAAVVVVGALMAALVGDIHPLVALAELQFLEPLLHSTIAEQFMGVSRNGLSQARHSSGCISKRHRI